jgi:DNA-directed RNA polymerase subunit RPC12/RpoP
MGKKKKQKVLKSPKTCRYCNSKVELVSNKEVYGREYGNGKCYKCVKCGAFVGVHPDLKTPLGILADKELRELRKKAHGLFDRIWKNKKNYESRTRARNKAYKKLAEKLGIPYNECHFSWFDKDTILEAIEILETKDFFFSLLRNSN